MVNQRTNQRTLTDHEVSKNLAENVLTLRRKRRLTQAALASLAQIPRSTLTYIESGQGNPSLQNLSRLSLALQVSIEELLAPVRGRYKLVRRDEVAVANRAQGRVKIFALLPDPIPGMHMDRMELEAGGRMAGVPHVAGTKEYLTCMQGEIILRTGGQSFTLQRGDVLAFPGDQPHVYENSFRGRTVCISVVVIAPSSL